jgi:hypothetical protein
MFWGTTAATMAAKNRNLFDHPLTVRYSSEEMSQIWSDQKKFSTWRRLWIALATAEMELGLPIKQSQIDSLSANVNDIDFEYAEAKEKELRHDVMSHIHAFGKQCPDAAGIIYLGATSCFITDNSRDDADQGEHGHRAEEAPEGHQLAARHGGGQQVSANLGLHPLPAGPAHHRRQARDLVAAGFHDGL